jgi:hypothetical protein
MFPTWRKISENGKERRGEERLHGKVKIKERRSQARVKYIWR